MKPMAKAIGNLLLLLFGVTALPQDAFASAQDLFGFGSRCSAMANACLASVRSDESVFYNPAGLGGASQKTFFLSYSGFLPHLQVQGLANTEYALPEATQGVAFGIAVPLSLPSPVDKRIGLGLGIFQPTQSLIEAKIPLANTPWFPVLGNRANTLGILLGVGVELPWNLKVGMGVRMLAALEGEIAVTPGPSGALSSSIRDELLTAVSPQAGLQYTLGDWEFAAAYRGEERAEFSLPIQADLGEDFPLEVPAIRIAGIAQFDPAQIAAGSSWRLEETLTVALSVLWRQWSAYPGPVEEATQAAPANRPPDFSDTFSPRAGLEYRWPLGATQTLNGRIGLGFETSPATEDSLQSGYLDAHRYVVSGGLGWSWMPTSEHRIRLSTHGQFHRIAEREGVLEVSPETRVELGGHLIHLGASVGVDFP